MGRSSGAVGSRHARLSQAHSSNLQSNGDFLDDRHVISRTSATIDLAARRDTQVGVSVLLHRGSSCGGAIRPARYDIQAVIAGLLAEGSWLLGPSSCPRANSQEPTDESVARNDPCPAHVGHAAKPTRI